MAVGVSGLRVGRADRADASRVHRAAQAVRVAAAGGVAAAAGASKT